MLQIFILLIFVYFVLVIYLEYLVHKAYKRLFSKSDNTIGSFFVGYRKKLMALKEFKESDIEVKKALSIENMVKKISLLILFLAVVAIFLKKS